jgi:hypothetical protein
MRRAGALLVLLAVLGVPASAHATQRRCRPPATGVVARSGANVLFVRAIGPDDGEYGPPQALFGCWSARHSPRRLVTFPDESTGSLTRLGADRARARFAGHFAAFSLVFTSSTCEKYAQSGCASVLTESVSLRTGRRRAQARSPLAADDLALTGAGWFGWLPTGPDPPLLGVDSGGQRTLDPGPVDAGSLSASGSGVAWTVAGARRGALLG